MTPGRAAVCVLCVAACQPVPAARFDAGLDPIAVSVPCPDGWFSNSGACDATLPMAVCPAGTMPVIGKSDCVGVGHVDCGAGFVASASGWGCEDVMPDAGCTGATKEVLGQTGCQPVGDCAAAFPPANAAFFVDDSYDAGQLDATHFASISAAVTAAPAGAVIAIDEGLYRESLTVAKNLTLAGRCAEKVIVKSAAGPDGPGLWVTAGAAAVSGVTMTNQYNGVYVKPGASLTLDRVVISGNEICGVNANGDVVMNDSVVRDGFQDSTGKWGEGVIVASGANVEIHRSVVSHNTEVGILAQDNKTKLRLDAVIVRDTQPAKDLTQGEGIVIYDGANATLTGCVIAHNAEVGLSVEGPTRATVASVDQCVIRDTRQVTNPRVDPNNAANKDYLGMNLEGQGRVTLDVSRTTLLRSGGNALYLASAPAVATFNDSTIVTTDIFPDGYSTCGMVLQAGAVMTLTRSAIAQASGVGIQAYGVEVTLVDSLIAQTLSLGTTELGYGLLLGSASTGALQRSAITQTAGTGVYMASIGGSPSGTLMMDSSVISDGVGLPAGDIGGRGVDFTDAASVTVTSSAVVRNRECGVIASGVGTNVSISKSVVRETRNDGRGITGRGINTQSGAHLELFDSFLTGNHDVSLASDEDGTTVLAQRVVITNSLADAADGHFGLGALALIGGRLDLKQVQISGSANIGVAVSMGTATLEACTIADNLVGIHAQDGSTIRQVSSLPDDVTPLDVLVTDDTVFIGNATRVGDGEAPIPESP